MRFFYHLRPTNVFPYRIFIVGPVYVMYSVLERRLKIGMAGEEIHYQ